MRKILNEKNGVAGVIVALLLVGFFISIIAFIQSVYVPQWMQEKEAEHMNEVATQFSQLKFAIDTLSASEQKYSSISTPITLGSKEIPFLFSSRSYGNLEILSNDYRIIFTDIDGNYVSVPINSIRYSSENAYYINQNYVYENGAVILNQDSGDVITVQPNIYFENNEISLELIRLYEYGGKTTASGFGIYPVQTRYSNSEMIDVYSIEHITIYNSHLEAWASFFDKFLSKEYGSDFDIQPTADGLGIEISFTNIENLPNILLKITDIKLQIAPGWIE